MNEIDAATWQCGEGQRRAAMDGGEAGGDRHLLSRVPGHCAGRGGEGWWLGWGLSEIVI